MFLTFISFSWREKLWFSKIEKISILVKVGHVYLGWNQLKNIQIQDSQRSKASKKKTNAMKCLIDVHRSKIHRIDNSLSMRTNAEFHFHSINFYFLHLKTNFDSFSKKGWIVDFVLILCNTESVLSGRENEKLISI